MLFRSTQDDIAAKFRTLAGPPLADGGAGLADAILHAEPPPTAAAIVAASRC